MTFTATPSPAKSLLRAATQTTSSPPDFAPRAPSPIAPSSLPSLPSQLSTFNSSSTPSPSSPSAPSSCLKSEISNPKSPSLSSETPLQDELPHIQQKVRTAMRQWSPDDPRLKPLLENYNSIMQAVTLERLNASLPTLSESAWVETNEQIIRLHSVMERTNSRHSREQRETEAQARRELRDQQTKERQAQREIDNRAKEQRHKEREESRRQREKEKSERAEQKHQTTLRALDVQELDITTRQNNPAPSQSPSAPRTQPQSSQRKSA